MLRDTVIGERIVQLREVLDRIEVPAFADIPDREAMAARSTKRWRLPDTEIDFALIESGPQAGEFLVSAETVDRLPEFYQRVKHLPYRSGPAADLYGVYRAISLGGSATIHDAFLSSPIGLSYIIPPRWMLGLPGWAKARIVDVAAWQWLGLSVGLLIGGLVIFGCHRATRSRADGSDSAEGSRWHALLVPLAIMFVAGLFVPLLTALLRVGGMPRVAIDYAQTGAVYLGAAWLAIAISIVIGEAIVASDRLTSRSLDSQLIRLGMRLIGLVAAIAILIQGGDQLGFPAYSILAGLGVGGLAVALAAQSTIAKSYRFIAHCNREAVSRRPRRPGRRERRHGGGCRFPQHPHQNAGQFPGDNSEQRGGEHGGREPQHTAKRRQRFFVQVMYDTPREKLKEIVAGIKQLIVDHPLVEEATCQVRFNNFAESSLDILVIFNLVVQDYTSELREREAILLQIMDLVKDAGVEFAFPTRTLYIEEGAGSSAARSTPDRVVSAFAVRP